MEASSNAISNKSDIRMSSLPVQNVSFVVQGCFSSPTQVSQKHAERNNGAVGSVALTTTTTMDRLFHPSSQIVGKIRGGGHSGPMQEPKGTFSEKRSRLLLLAAGTRSKNIDDFLSNRSDFILEILLRLGIRKNANKLEKFQNPEQDMSAHQFPASSRRSDQIVKFSDNSQENSCTYKTEQHENFLALKWDNTEIQVFPCNHSLKTSLKCKHWKSNLLAEKAATLLPNFENPASAIELIKEFDCNKYSYTDRALTLLNSPCGLSEVNFFPTDCANYMEQLYKDLHFNSALDLKGLFDFCVTKDTDTSINSKLEVDSSNHGPHRKNYDSSQADCIFPNIYNSESFFQEQPFTPYIHPEIAKEQFTFPLLEWDVTAEQELPALKCLVPKEVDHFTKSLNGTFDFHNEIGSSSFCDAYRRKSFSFLTELQF
ncbi:hypothetical protein M5K25_016370 [Dendrobium thyrsiflorum]|uniref:Uncharacterized protein n=1 Tax=Dendrobium thyrsiflorum TaxID=117978 RepID=A0ABD0UK33_DENTH